MDILIFIVLIGYAVYRSQTKGKKQKKKYDTPYQAYPKGNAAQYKNQQQNQMYSQNTKRPQSNAKPQKTNKANNSVKAQSAYKNQQQYRQAEILNKAKLNVAVSDLDELKAADQLRHGYGKGITSEVDTESLMPKINDLIVMGYQGDMTFPRDFISEGVDMLNRIQG